MVTVMLSEPFQRITPHCRSAPHPLSSGSSPYHKPTSFLDSSRTNFSKVQRKSDPVITKIPIQVDDSMNELETYQEKWMREGGCQKMGQRDSTSGGGTLCGDRGSQLGVPLFFSLSPLDKTSSSVLLSPCLHSLSLCKHVQPGEHTSPGALVKDL